MEQEDKVCTLEQAKRLRELGFEIETEKSWIAFESGMADGEVWDYELLNSETCGDSKCVTEFYYPAPDVAELGIALEGYSVMKYANDSIWRLYDPKGLLQWIPKSYNLPEAQARCEALIYLIENGYMENINDPQ